MLPTHLSKILSKRIYPKKCVLAISPKNSTNKCHNIISPIKQTSTTSIPNKTPLQIVKNFSCKDSVTNFPKIFINEFSQQLSQTYLCIKFPQQISLTFFPNNILKENYPSNFTNKNSPTKFTNKFAQEFFF